MLHILIWTECLDRLWDRRRSLSRRRFILFCVVSASLGKNLYLRRVKRIIHRNPQLHLEYGTFNPPYLPLKQLMQEITVNGVGNVCTVRP